MKLAIAAILLSALGACGGLPPAVQMSRQEPVAQMADIRSAQRGAAFAQARCASCHAVNPVGASPLAAAPRFRDLGRLYPVEQLAEAFAEGITTAHSPMPEFVLSPTENADLINYLKSIQGSGEAGEDGASGTVRPASGAGAAG